MWTWPNRCRARWKQPLRRLAAVRSLAGSNGRPRPPLAELMARDLSGLDVGVIMIDGLEIAGQCCVVALVICVDGTKIPVGLWLGDTENKTVVTGLLSDLQARGLSVNGGLLAVLDGAKALAAGIRKVFGDRAQIQRCTLHKRRNVKGYLPKELAAKIDWRLARAFAEADPAKGLDAAKRIAGELKADHPDAAASLLEGLEEMFTVRRLGVGGRLAETLTNTNCIESMISVARTTMSNVKNWKDGTMKKRWVAAGMLEAERNFRRVRGYKEMPILVAALHRAAASDTVPTDNYHQAAA
jgi:putative transposase